MNIRKERGHFHRCNSTAIAAHLKEPFNIPRASSAISLSSHTPSPNHLHSRVYREEILLKKPQRVVPQVLQQLILPTVQGSFSLSTTSGHVILLQATSRSSQHGKQDVLRTVLHKTFHCSSSLHLLTETSHFSPQSSLTRWILF